MSLHLDALLDLLKTVLTKNWMVRLREEAFTHVCRERTFLTPKLFMVE